MDAYEQQLLIRWRIASLIINALLRPNEPTARLIDLPDNQALHLARFLSALVLLVVVLIGFARVALAGADSGAAHVISLITAFLVCGLYTLAVFRSRRVAEALIRGRPGIGIISAIRVRAALARAWLGMSLAVIGGLLVVFIAGLSLGLLSYYRAVSSTLGILLVLMILGRLMERGWHDAAVTATDESSRIDGLVARTARRIVRAVVVMIALLRLAWVWIEALEQRAAEAAGAMHSIEVAAGTLFVAYVRLAVADAYAIFGARLATRCTPGRRFDS